MGGPPRSGGERSEPERSGGPPIPVAGEVALDDRPPVASAEVPARPVRRRFTADYKRRILRESDECGPGGVAALLRREGLYSSHLNTWKRQRSAGEIAGLEPRKRGRKAIPRNPLAGENERLQRENKRLQKRLHQAEIIIDVQKKLCEMLGLPVATTDSNGDIE
jgi:transposase